MANENLEKVSPKNKSSNKKKNAQAVQDAHDESITKDADSSSGESEAKKIIRPDTKKIPIVAIGASAGGLEPFEQFFDATDPDTGVAYVVIQHLSPDFKSMMGDLLGRHSTMNIEQVVDGLAMKANTIYLNPPRTHMTLDGGYFRLKTVDNPNELSLPIDIFFYSMAKNYGKDAIAIVLSGTGSDGTRGAIEVHQHGGKVLIQDPKSSKFDGMPLSVANAGCADGIGGPRELPGMVQAILRGDSLDEELLPAIETDPYGSIYALLLRTFGNDFRNYKIATIHRRLERRAKLLHITMQELAVLLHRDHAQIEQVYEDLLIDVTAFFRDSDAFEVLATKAIPKIAHEMSEKRQIRIWIPGCASGEEPYSIAIAFAEYARENELPLNIKILATDIHQRSIASASLGYYPEDLLADMDPELRDRYFHKEGEHYQVDTQLRRMVLFSQHNVLKDPPFTRIDLISHRNVLIYMTEIAQQKILTRFHFSLRDQGILFLGSSETLGKIEEEFDTISAKHRIYKKARDVRILEPGLLVPMEGTGASRESVESAIQSRVKLTSMTAQTAGVMPMRRSYNRALESMLTDYAPTGFLLNTNGEIEHIFGDAGDKLSVVGGTFSKKVVDLVNESLKVPISTGLERMRTLQDGAFERRVIVKKDGDNLSVTIKIASILDQDGENPNQVTHYLLTIDDGVIENEMTNATASASNAGVATGAPLTLGEGETVSILQQRIADLELDLQSTEQSLQSTIEEMETTNEELQATNEELMASNEELQSTNEELHSVNEELYTVSSEHQTKINELTVVTDDMDHLLRATNIGILFLDHELKMRRFTPSATIAFNVLPQDIGRPIEHLTHQFDMPNLHDVIHEVRSQEVISYEKEVEIKGVFYMLRLLPYTTTLDEENGVVITLIDISELKAVQQAQIEAATLHREIVSDLDEFIVRWDAVDDKITFANKAYFDLIGQSEAETLGQDSSKVLNGAFSDQNARVSHLNGVETNAKAGEYSESLSASIKEKLLTGEIVTMLIQAENEQGLATQRQWRLSGIPDESGSMIAFQAVGRDLSESYRYNTALEQLQSLGSLSADADFTTIFERILHTAREYLQMDIASAGIYIENHFHVYGFDGTHKKSPVAVGESVAKNASLPLTETNMLPLAMAELPVESGEVAAIDNYKNSEFSVDPFFEASELQSYLGTTSISAQDSIVSIAFASREKRAKPFTNYENTFVKLVWKFCAFWIEQQRQVESLIDNQQELEIVNDNLSRFSYIASHDLQEPLRKIRQFGELLTDEYSNELKGDGEYFIKVMTDAATRMSTLVKDLLNYSKSSNYELKLNQYDLNEVLGASRSDLSSLIESTGAEITVDRLPQVSCDSSLVQQLITNLLSNSIKYVEENTTPKITISASDHHTHWQLEFEDNGIGISNDSDQDIFDAFTRLHSRDEYDGSGIGLATCKLVCDRHGWGIDYDKDPDPDGAKFIITVPK